MDSSLKPKGRLSRQENSNHNRSIGGYWRGFSRWVFERGYDVVATSREANQKLTSSDSLVLLDGDIGKQQTAAYAVDVAINKFGTIDVLVNNAGIFLKKPFTDFTAEEFNALVSTNLPGFFYITQRNSARIAETAENLTRTGSKPDGSIDALLQFSHGAGTAALGWCCPQHGF